MIDHLRQEENDIYKSFSYIFFSILHDIQNSLFPVWILIGIINFEQMVQMLFYSTLINVDNIKCG